MPIERYKRLLIFCCVYDIITVEKHIAGVCCYGGMFGYLPILILGGASFAGPWGTKRYECQTKRLIITPVCASAEFRGICTKNKNGVDKRHRI